MRVLMLGWEFPPFITGGLGTACHGLTRALDARGVAVTFLLPRTVSETGPTHVRLVGADAAGQPHVPDPEEDTLTAARPEGFRHVTFIGIEAGFAQPYDARRPERGVAEITGAEEESGATRSPHTGRAQSGSPPAASPSAPDEPRPGPPPASGPDYGGDIVEQADRYARYCVRAARGLPFDVIHAHDWMTFPAGLWIARASGRPLIAHVHSTEFDRSGEGINQRIYDIERRGMHGALRVIAVSQLTRNQIVSRYGVPADKVEVVYNGVDMEPGQMGMTGIESRDKIVLYFGRITFQKGPEYFIRAAKRVLEVMSDVKFVVAGSGDMAQRMIEMAAELGIGHKVLFTGFLRGNDIKRVFALADLYVMPSVSEPFGIAPLEAMSHDVPVLISRSSGVSEVLTHALKVDFWDIDDMANKIVAVLRHPPLSQTLREHGRFEVRRLTWEGAAQKCEQLYAQATASLHQRSATIR